MNHPSTSMIITLQGTNISPEKCIFEDDFPFPQVGYVNSLEGMFQPLNLQTSELFPLSDSPDLKPDRNILAGDSPPGGCFGGPKAHGSPGFPRRSPGWLEVVYIGQDMIKDLATKTSKVSKMSKKCEKKVKRGEAKSHRDFFF